MVHAPVRAGDIVAALETDKRSVRRQVATLEEMGPIDYRDDPADRRATLLVLSPKAQAVRVEFRAEMRESYEQTFAGWTDDEVASFTVLLPRSTDSSEG